MLVLSRKENEAIRISGNILVKIFEVKGNQVKIGIDAPKEVSILREELYEQVKNENHNSLMLSKPDLTQMPKFLIKKK